MGVQRCSQGLSLKAYYMYLKARDAQPGTGTFDERG